MVVFYKCIQNNEDRTNQNFSRFAKWNYPTNILLLETKRPGQLCWTLQEIQWYFPWWIVMAKIEQITEKYIPTIPTAYQFKLPRIKGMSSTKVGD